MKFYKQPLPTYNELRQAIIQAYRGDEASYIKNLLSLVNFSPEMEQKIRDTAADLVATVRKQTQQLTGIEALIMHYDLSTTEGIMLMCIAESLLRIPDKETENLLIRDKLTSANWQSHLGKSQSAFVNLTTWGLALTGKILDGHHPEYQFDSLWNKLLRRAGEPVIRKAIFEAVKIMGNQFVVGHSIDQALKASQEMVQKGYLFSYDMLGEVARTREDADRYFRAYQQAIAELNQKLHLDSKDIVHGPGISVKLSALYPRYDLYSSRNGGSIFN